MLSLCCSILVCLASLVPLGFPLNLAVATCGDESHFPSPSHLVSGFKKEVFSPHRWQVFPLGRLFSEELPFCPHCQCHLSCLLLLAGLLLDLEEEWVYLGHLPSDRGLGDMEYELLFIAGSVQFSHSVVSDSLQPPGLQHTRPPCPSPTPGVYSDSCPLSRWCHPSP